MLFLLASISAGILLGQIDTTLPDKGPPAASAAGDPDKNPNEQPLKLVVSISASQNKIILWSISGLEGTLQNPKAEIPRIPWQVAVQNKLYKKNDTPVPVFDTGKLNKALEEIAKRRWQGKKRNASTYQIVLMADDTIPYGTIIPVMDALRCRLSFDPKKVAKACVLPRFLSNKEGKAVAEGELTADVLGKYYGKDRAGALLKTQAGNPGKICLPDGACVDGYACKPPEEGKDTPPVCSTYDSSKMALFHDILFSTGFE
jgi:hypothetical protein